MWTFECKLIISNKARVPALRAPIIIAAGIRRSLAPPRPPPPDFWTSVTEFIF